MGPNFKHLYDTSSAASRLVKTWDKEIIPVNTFDSLTLEGWFYTAGENARDTAILVHGYNSSPMGDMSAIMQFYLRRGINVLLTNNRGGKTSVGNNITFGLYERLDTALWVDKLNERFPDGSIILHGISLGGATVCLMSELDLKTLNASCRIAPTPRSARNLRTVRNSPWVSRRKPRWNAFINFCKEFGNTVDDFTPLRAVQHAQYPILFIHGKEDRFIPVRMAHELYNACSSDKRLFLVDGAGHGASYANAPKEYESAVMDFVNANK